VRDSARLLAGWLFLASAFVAVLMTVAPTSMSLGAAVRTSAGIFLPAPIFGWLIWRLSARYRWPSTPRFGFALFHLAMALLFALAWVVVLIALSAPQHRWDEVMARARPVLGWQILFGVFLFNALHSITTLIPSEPHLAVRALENVSDMFRYILSLDRQQKELVTIEEEWKFTERYLELEQLRLGGRLRVEVDLDPGLLGVPIPPFTIQSLVENAVKHGIRPLQREGCIRVDCAVDRDGEVVLTVADDGCGAEPERLLQSGGLGLRAVVQRLENCYGRPDVLAVETAPGRGCTVTLALGAGLRGPARGERQRRAVG
jgi:signal transduction histidine kinase